jgi:hypothetical protein
MVKDLNGNPLTGVVGITFALYSEQTGGTALWLETQNITADGNGHYVALLGSTKPDGLPTDVFTSEQARWVGVQISGQAEQPRVLLVSAPYALKAGDAETLGGLPPSAFMLANGSQGAASSAKGASAPAAAGAQKNSVPPANPAVTGKGVVDYIPMWDTTSDIVDSIIFQKSSEIGINTATPAALLDVNGKTDLRDTLTLFPKSTDNTLAINGTAFKISDTGSVTFISGQKFPGTAQLAKANTFTNLQTISANSSTNPALQVTNASGTGFDIGIQISAPAGYAGLLVENAGEFGVSSTADYQGGYFLGDGGGTYSENDVDRTDAVGAYAFEMGTTQLDIGFWGYSASTLGVGVYGQAVQASATGGEFAGLTPNGVWGDTGAKGGAAVFGTVDDGISVLGYNNSSDYATGVFGNYEDSDKNGIVLEVLGVYYESECVIDVSGNLNCSGTITGVAPVDGGSRKVALNSVQSPEAWFEDAGSGQLTGGQAVVNIESVFGQTINTGVEYHVFLTPNGDCKGLYVAEKSATSFVVKELGGGTSSIAFDYRIMAKRKSFENVRLADVTRAMTIKRPVKSAANAKHLPSAQSVRQQVQEHAKRRTVAGLSGPASNKKQ